MMNNDFNPFDELETHTRVLMDHRDQIEMLSEEVVRLNLLIIDLSQSNQRLAQAVLESCEILKGISAQ